MAGPKHGLRDVRARRRTSRNNTSMPRLKQKKHLGAHADKPNTGRTCMPHKNIRMLPCGAAASWPTVRSHAGTPLPLLPVASAMADKLRSAYA